MPMLTRRESLLGAASVALSANALAIAVAADESAQGRDVKDLASDEAYWASVARAYQLDGRWIVLNGGGNNPIPDNVISALSRYTQQAASQPRPYNYRQLAHINDHRVRLAKLFNCMPEEMAITRNTTEGLNTVCWGLPLSAGDEVITTNFEHRYAGVILKQRAERHGIIVREVNIPPSPSAEDVISQFRTAISPKTKLIVASHLVDGWGFVLPIKKLSELAHEHGAHLLADGALTFGQMPIDMQELGCDYYATSLHKWLNAPLGTGALFVRKDRIETLWPLYGSRREKTDIRKYEDIGTRSGPTIAAIGQALDFYERIGPARKAARVKYLTSLVIDQLSGVKGVSVITERDPDLRTGLARIAVKGFSGRELTTLLREQHRIYTFGNFPGPVNGVYISPNIFNSDQHMASFSNAIKIIAAG